MSIAETHLHGLRSTREGRFCRIRWFLHRNDWHQFEFQSVCDRPRNVLSCCRATSTGTVRLLTANKEEMHRSAWQSRVRMSNCSSVLRQWSDVWQGPRTLPTAFPCISEKISSNGRLLAGNPPEVLMAMMFHLCKYLERRRSASSDRHHHPRVMINCTGKAFCSGRNGSLKSVRCPPLHCRSSGNTLGR